ncbi:MAG: MGMT family protein [Bacteroidales bacterium]|nr:MGMT family protein [Bacteroidales bacterium]
MNNYFDRIYETVLMIPEGRVTNYGAIARFIGSAQSSRMVGWALSQSFTQKVQIPAHRVVNRLGILSGKKSFSSPTLMQELLENEGIKVVDDKIVNFDKYFWDPNWPDK